MGPTKNKKINKRCIQSKHGLGYKQQQNVFSSNIFVYPQQQQKLPSPTRVSTTSNPYFVCDDDLELAKKISLHYQQHIKPNSRKRKKFASMERDGFEFDAPSKKRAKMNAFGGGRGRGKKRMRMKQKKIHRGKNNLSEDDREEDS